jgi:membrane protein DedA with SNARE-associated domain
MLETLKQLVETYIEQFHYLGPFVVLLLCGVGLPIPEEAVLLPCGALVQHGVIDFWTVSGVCSLAILLGDSIPYWLGRRWGMRALQNHLVRKVLHPEFFAKFEAKFERHRTWATFLLRFLPGLRIPGYFVVGTLRMSYLRFIVIDGLGVAVSVPTSIWFGGLLGAHIKQLVSGQGSGLVVAALVVVAIGLAVLVKWATRRVATAPPQPPEAKEPVAHD